MSAVAPAEAQVETVVGGVPLFGLYFTAAHYLRVIPYQIKYDLDRKWWSLGNSKIHMVTCVILTWIPCIAFESLRLLHEFLHFCSLPKRSSNSYFKMGHRLLNWMIFVVYFWIVVRKRQEMESTLNSCHKILALNNRGFRPVTKFGVRGAANHNNNKIISSAITRSQVYFSVVGIVLLALFVGRMFVEKSSGMIDWPVQVFQSRILLARKWLFLSVPDDSNAVELSGENVLLGILFFWGRLAFEVVTVISQIVLMGPYPLTLWLATKKFEIFLHRNESGERENNRFETAELSRKEVADIGEMYEDLRQLSHLLNASWGRLNFIWHLARTLRTIFVFQSHNVGSWNLSGTLGLALMRVTCQAAALVFSADVFVKMDNFRYWLITPKNWTKFWLSESRSQVERMHMELGGGPVGVSWNGIYQCTYGFIAQLLALIVTIVVVTFENH